MSNSSNITSDLVNHVNFNFLATSLILGLAVNWGLLGMLCIQVYTYYLAFPHDRLQAKLQVYAVLIFELLQSAVVAHDVVISLAVQGLENFPATFELAHDLRTSLDSIHTHWFSIPLAGGLIGGVGQLFFAYRIWMISSEKVPTIAICVLSVASICSAVVSSAFFFNAKSFSFLLVSEVNDGFASITAWNMIGAICDISIALSMPYYLMRHGTGLPSTHILIVRLVRLLFETGGFTAIMAILHACLYVSKSECFVIPGLCMSKIYAITMLMIFNNRIKISGGRFDQDEDGEGECDFASSRLSRDQQHRGESRRDSGRKTKIFVSSGRLTFQLGDLPPSPSATSVENHDTSSPFSTDSPTKVHPEA